MALVGGVAGLAGLAGLAGGVAYGRKSLAPLPPGARLSYAQAGEDLILVGHVDALGLATPSYLDVGAWEPIISNNTYLLYLRGGRGVLVEPNPALAETIRRERPEDKLLSVGIGVMDAAEADYYVFTEPQLNTFDPEQVPRALKYENVRLQSVIKVPLVNINRVIAEHVGGKAPDVLSIDIEGLDLKVLKTLDYDKYRPKVICAETLITSSRQQNPETTAFMTSKGYEVRGMTFVNTFYVDRKLLD
jgi:FkbM family methyltransferase